MDYRYVFLVGVLPAFFTLWIRRNVLEPEEWAGERGENKLPKISDLFGPEVRKTTLMVLGMASICLTTVWAFLYFSNQVVRSLPEVKKLSKEDQEDIIFWVTVSWTLFNVAANFLGGALSKFIGYRKAMAIMLAGAFCCYFFGYREPHDLATTRWILNLSAFFASGIFAIFPLYIPPLFPTLLRTTGAGFCYNFGRVFAGFGVLYAGQLIGKNFPGIGIFITSALYLVGIILAFFMPQNDRA